MTRAARSLPPATVGDVRAEPAAANATPAPLLQLVLPYPTEVWGRVPRARRSPRAPHAPVVVVQLDLPFDAARPARLKLLVPAGVGGPDPARPCVGCPKRARCRTPCILLANMLPDEDTTAWNEVGSRALMEGRGYDDAFMSQPAALAAEEPEDLWPEVVARYGGERLRGAMDVLTQQQQEVMSLFLGGMSRAEIGTGRATSRQATHKVWWAAIGRLARVLGPLPPRTALAATAQGDARPEG